MKKANTARVREALAACAPNGTVIHPEKSPAVIELSFPAELVRRPGAELCDPGDPHDDGRYWCLLELSPDGRALEIMARSNRSWNADAWVTLTTLLDDVWRRLGGS